MLINLKVKTLDAQTHDFSIDNEITVREFKDKIAEKTNIASDQQRIIYCGRVLADEKQIKEYDVDGKVVHVAERPPPSQRGPSTSSALASENSARERPGRANMRNSPLFRAIDGMLVGTMAIPMNVDMQNNGRAGTHPFTSSSTFSMNRITVARHMLECANNIAAYLEDPERGLNNTALDILASGRWTMESTVVEVGISASDLPQNQNIVEMVQGAVTAALSRNANRNVTVVQLPSLFGSNESEEGEEGEGAGGVPAASAENATDNATVSNESGGAGASFIVDVMDSDDDGATNASSSAAQAGSANTSNSSSNSGGGGVSAAAASADAVNNSASTGTNTDENPARRQTNTNVLAEVVEQMRTVQARLNPFIDQFCDLLQNEPTFEENDTTGRENAQRLYDRVSEAFHYMSHAQHAISDLMLDVSQPAPRFLTCRPILVEQSGYVSSNSYLSAAAAAAAAASAVRQQQPQQQAQPQLQVQQQQPQQQSTTQPQPTAAASSATTSAAPSTAASGSNTAAIEDPVDDPVVTPNVPPAATNAANVGTQSNDDNTLEIVLQPRRGLYFGNNHQMQMAQLIQAVVNSAPVDTEFRVQINAPSIVSFGVPMNVAQAQAARSAGAQPQAAAAATVGSTESANESSNTSPTGTAAAIAAGSANSGNGGNGENNASGSFNLTATLPTTATQTRSTSRPQLHIPTNAWNGRFVPTTSLSAFDRFLPCNSHHVQEPESDATNGNGTGGATRGATPVGAHAIAVPNPNMANTASRRGGLNNLPGFLRTLWTPRAARPTSNRPTRSNAGAGITASTSALRHMLSGMPPQPPPNRRSAARAAIAAAVRRSSLGDPTVNQRDLRSQLLGFINNTIFAGQPINGDTTPAAINRAISWFGETLIYLPQHERPMYDARSSIANVLRNMLPMLIEVLNHDHTVLFEPRLELLCQKLIKRLFSVLHVCIGRENAEMYWNQMMRPLVEPMHSNFQNEALVFLRHYIRTDIPSSFDTADVQQFIVRRDVTPAQQNATPMDTDTEMGESPGTSAEAMQTNSQLATETEAATAVDDETLPNVAAGTEPWHRHFPNDWLPVISRDVQVQAAHPPTQAPFSDAYISGMSAKRRKMIQSNKPPTDVGSLVAESVRKSIQNVGVTTSTASNQSLTPDDITNAIASDSAVQASYTEAVRTNLRERLKKDPDYKDDKYPQTTKFLNK